MWLLLLLTATPRLASCFQTSWLPSKGKTLLFSAPSSQKVEKDIGSDELMPLASATETSKSFRDFDYESHWYPVVWTRDLPLKKPVKVTLFDTDYVVARVDDETVYCLKDRCPHKSAALSEGRVTSSGYFQCAYHGWSFDGTDGSCVEIPQVEEGSSFSSRACGEAMPAMVQNGMVWLFPGGNLEAALQVPPPPFIPEMEQEGFKTAMTVRDFPVDWTILIENIVDPDHGLFAHGAVGFDLYTASKEAPQEIEEGFTNNGKGWAITSRVKATSTLTTLDKIRRGKKVKDEEVTDADSIKIGTTTFTAPNHVVVARRNKNNETSFITAFWICPTGTGRSRFLSASIGKTKVLPPRWLMHVILNNFLDQDTFLLATQQKHVLQAEAEAIDSMVGDPKQQSTNVRKKTYVYRSPTERIGVRLGAFWDATLNRVPKRLLTLKKLDSSGALKEVPSRQFVLDREMQHLRICPESQQAVENCSKIQKLASFSTFLLVLGKAWSRITTAGSAASRIDSLLTPTFLASSLSVSAVSGWLAGKVKREFFFKYSEQYRDRDLEKISKLWLDKE